MKETVKIVGVCSKWIDGEGWVTEIPKDEYVKQIRNQAIREFTERLKEYSITEYKEFGALRFYKISYPQLDELVEEMTK